MNINRLTKISFAALGVVIGLSGFNVNTATAAIINLDALDASGVTLNLTAGNYQATPIGVADGACSTLSPGLLPAAGLPWSMDATLTKKIAQTVGRRISELPRPPSAL